MRRNLFLLIALLAAYPAFAQDRGVGLPAFGSYTGSAMDSVNNQNLNVHATFPILPPTGRAFGFGFSEVHDSQIWMPVPSGGSSAWTPGTSSPSPYGGWQMLSSGGTLNYTETDDSSTCTITIDFHTYTPHNRLQTNFVFFDAQGTPHQFPGAQAIKNSCTLTVSGSSPVYSSDHTGYLLNPGIYTVTGANGAQFVSGAITDANGNYISQTYQNDQNQHATTWTLTNGQTVNQTSPGNTVTVISGPITASVTSASYNVKTAFGCPNVSEFTGTIYLPSSITTPGGLTYTLAYEPTPGYSGYFTGRLASITSSTGGVTTYSYAGNNGGINCADGTGLGLTEVVNDTVNTSTYTYTRTGNTTTVTLPDGTTTVYTFDSLGRETSRKLYAGAATGTPLRQVNTTFDSNNFPTTSITILEDGSTQSKQATTFDSFGNLTNLSEYDYGSGAPGALLRQTVTSPASLNNNILNLPASITIKDGPGNIKAQTNFTYDEGTPTSTSATQHTSVSGSRGNVTTVSSLVSGSTYVHRSVAYYDTGEVRSATDFNANATTYAYPSTHNTVGPTTVTNALSQSTTYAYDAASGLVTSVVDPNSRSISYSYDGAMRPTDIFYPDGGHTGYAYPSPHETDVYQQIDNTGRGEAVVKLTDALGRPSQTMLTSDPGGVDYVDTTYDNLGRVHTVSNPYRSTSESTYGLTTYAYDALGRTTTVTEQDNSSQVSASYALNCTTATDEAGKKRKSCSDGLGRVTQVFEDPAGVNYETDYQYDTLDNLICAAQKGTNTGTFTNCASTPAPWRPRSFSYDALSRLTSSTNPESGVTSYTYDNNGNVTTKTDARGVTATFAYDALNRIVEKYFSDGTPYVYYGYEETSGWGYPLANTVGRLSSIGTTHGIGTGWITAAIFSYDSMGREIFTQTITGNTMPIVASTYDLMGNLTSLSYPSGRVVKTAYDTAARPTEVSYDNFNGTHITFDYLSSAQYAPNGAPTILSLNGIAEAYSYNSRLQPCSQQISIGTFMWSNRNYSYYPSGSCTGSSGNNGNVASIADALQSNRTQSFSYDSLNRLASAQSAVNSGADCWGQTYGYDAWANLVSESVSKCSAPSLSLSVGTNNRLTNSGFSYDLTGNMTHDASHAYTFDAENHLTKVDSGSTATYTYDADGSRVQKQVGSATTNYIYAGSQPIAEYNPTTGDWSDYVYAGSRRLAKADSFTDLLHMSITTSGGGVTGDNFAAPTALTTRWVTAGDMLYISEYQHDASGGFDIGFSDGTYADSSSGFVDQHGVASNADTGQGWHSRSFSMSAYAGKSISGMDFIMSSGASGTWDLEIRNMVYVTADGTVIPIYTEQGSFSVTHWGYQPGVTSRSFTVDHVSGQAIVPGTTTTFYHGDQLGSARAMSGIEGAPIWSATYLPFGQEWNPLGTSNHYKFTGYERDAEASLDFANARHYEYSLGRFMQPDPFNAGANPMNPHTWNMYTYGLNNPLNLTDPSGMRPDLCATLGSEDCLVAMAQCQASGGGGTCDEYSGSADCSLSGISFSCGSLLGPYTSLDVAAWTLSPTGLQEVEGGAAIPIFGNMDLFALLPWTPPSFDCAAHIPKGASVEYCGPLEQGFKAAKDALGRKAACSNSFGGKGSATLDATQYRFMDLHDPGTGAATIDLNNVWINSTGLFMTFSGGQDGPFGRGWSQGQFRGFILLHELGHQLSPITHFSEDAKNPTLNRMQSDWVISRCF